MKTLILILIMVSAMKGDIFRDSKPYKGSTTAKVVDVIGALSNNSTDEDLPGYNGAGNAYKDDLEDMWDFYYAKYSKGKKTPLTETINYNKKSDYEKIVNAFHRDEVGVTGHSSSIA